MCQARQWTMYEGVLNLPHTSPWLGQSEFVLQFFKNVLFNFERERASECEWVGEGQRERGTEALNRALCQQQQAQFGVWTHRLRDCDLSRSLTLNRVSHPGVPEFVLLLHIKSILCRASECEQCHYGHHERTSECNDVFESTGRFQSVVTQGPVNTNCFLD